ncbi:MAG: sulfatase [Caulobacteraceae bacterium]|nr:sulfatase [Caulobacteraceae bacterium]
MRFGISVALVAAAAVICAFPGMAAARPPPASGPPNIVFILADDFAANLVSPARLADSMPNLAQMMRDGVSFSNYFVTDSLCCPSRSSIFTGKFPHNTHVLTNSPPLGGFVAFVANGNDAHTFALTLRADGYATAMMGKYLNGYIPARDGVRPGWSEWDVAGAQGYDGFGYKLNQDGAIITHPEYLTDEISALGQEFIGASAPAPFFLELATFTPHFPYVPAHRDAHNFPGLAYDRGSPFGAQPNAAAPRWLQGIPPLTPDDLAVIDAGFRKRVQCDQAIDKLIGDVRAYLAAAGLSQNTYLVFSSDNGLHMGEYSLRPGKLTPFETDVHVPLVIVGPGVPAGVTIGEIAQNVDLAPTFTEIGGGGPGPTEPDGQSLLPLIAAYAAGGPPPAWRRMALIEHHRVAPADETDPDLPGQYAGNPPNYEALRLSHALYVEYRAPREVDYYDLTKDPGELHNIAASLTADRLARLHAILHANKACVGATACWAAQRMRP